MKTVKIKNRNLSFNIGKIVCVGRNYVEHIKELDNQFEEKPVIFLKPTSALIYSREKIIHPKFSDNLHHEAELVLLIGKKIKNASLNEAENAIIGYGVGLDMTLRDIQNELKQKGNPWTISKCFDTSAVISDFILKKDYQLTLNENILLKVNNEIRQNDPLNKMIFKPNELVQYISSLMTLEEGDLIFTGTPKGVSRIIPGDRIYAEISNVANLEVEVTEENL